MLLEKCTQSCGWIAAILATIAFGSFGVPIKKVSHINVDPLVMQTYMAFVCFITSWIVIPFGEKFEFSPMGILSGLFWIPSGVGGIYAIRCSGLALSVGIWCSLNVLCSFFWGIFIFEEKVRSLRETLVSLTILITGLVGMSVYASPPSRRQEESRIAKKSSELNDNQEHHDIDSTIKAASGKVSISMLNFDDVTTTRSAANSTGAAEEVTNNVVLGSPSSHAPMGMRTRKKTDNTSSSVSSLDQTTKYWDVESSTSLVAKKTGHPPNSSTISSNKKKNVKQQICFLGGRVCLSTQQLGKRFCEKILD